MKSLAWFLAALVLGAEPEAPTRSSADGLEVFVLTTAAPLADLAAGRAADGRPGLALLTLGPEGDKGQPGRLLFLPAGTEPPVAVPGDLPAGLTSLAASPNGWLLGQPGKIHRLDTTGQLTTVAQGAGLDLLSVAGGRRPAGDSLVVARAGRVTRFVDGESGFTAATTVPLPTTASRALFGLRIESPPVALLPGSDTAPALAVAGPLETGTRRLRSQVVDVTSGASHEAWSLLPGDETLIGASYDRLGSRPVLLAVTLEQIGLLVEKRVRMFSLPADRTRRGVPPILAFATDCPLWGTLTNHLTDTDGDGAVDLVTIYSHGLTLGSLAVEVRRGRSSGGFEATPRRSELSVEASDWRWVEDWTGDGRPDLVVLTDREVRVFPGTPGDRRPVAARPSAKLATVPAAWLDGGLRERTLELGNRGATIEERGPHLVPLDVDGDGQNELVAVTPGKEKRTAVAVLRRRAL